MKSIFCLLFLLALTCPSFAEDQVLPRFVQESETDGFEYLDVFTSPGVAFLDGRIDSNEALSFVRLRSLNGKGELADPSCASGVRLCDNGLYVGFLCEEPNMEERKILHPGGAASWDDDTVEVFLSLPGPEGLYWHLGVNPSGQKLFELKESSGLDQGWNSSSLQPPASSLSFKAVVSEGSGAWVAEMLIPFPTQGDLREGCRVCLARSRKIGNQEENSCWPFLSGDTFHRPDLFASLEIRDTSLAKVRWVKSVPAAEPGPVIPEPQVWEMSDRARIQVTDQWSIVVSDPQTHVLALTELQEFLSNRWGITLPVKTLSEEPSGHCIVLGTPNESPELTEAWQTLEARLPEAPAWQREEAYSLKVRKGGVTLAAQKERGLLYGVESLKGLFTDQARLPRATLWDWPSLQRRAWHLIAPETPEALPAAKDLIAVLARLKFNTVILQIDNRLEYEKNPGLSRPNAPSKEDLSDLVQCAEAHGMEVIPMTQCWSHFDYFLPKSEFHGFAKEPRLMAAAMLAGENAWSVGKPALEGIEWDPVLEFSRLSDQDEKGGSPEKFLCVDLSSKTNASLQASSILPCVTEEGGDDGYASLKQGLLWIDGTPFRILKESRQGNTVLLQGSPEQGLMPKSVRNIRVGARLSSIAFLHACTRPKVFATHRYDKDNLNPKTVGRYRILYEDGTEEIIPLRWERELSQWNSPWGAGLAPGGWRGKTSSGATLRLNRFVWSNPDPDKIIVSVDFSSDLDKASPYLAAITGMVNP